MAPMFVARKSKHIDYEKKTKPLKKIVLSFVAL
jgi:hypothetical protein